MGYIKSLIIPKPIEELERFLSSNNLSENTVKNIITEFEKNQLQIRGQIDYPGYENITAKFKSSPNAFLPPIEVRIPDKESQYTDLVARILHDAGEKVILICGAGIDTPIVHTGRFLDEYRDSPSNFKEAIVGDILTKVLFYGPSPLTERIANLAVELNYTIYTPNWTRHLAKLCPKNVVHIRKNTINYENGTLTIKLGSPVLDDVIRSIEARAETAETRLLLAIGISFRPQDRLEEVIRIMTRNKKWVIFIEVSDAYSVQEIYEEMQVLKIIDPAGALAIFRDEYFGKRVRSFDVRKSIF